VYARPDGAGEEDGPLTFGVSGRLWRDTLIMYDRETRTLWSQLLGRAIHGEMEGATLETVPFERTTWAEWKRLHPETLALHKQPGLSGSAYQGYFDSPYRLGISGRTLKDTRLPAKSVVFGLAAGGEAVAVPLEAGRRDVLEVRLNGGRVVVVRDGERAVGWKGPEARLRLAEGEGGPVLQDRAGKGRWDPWSGRSLVEEGTDLEPVAGLVTYWFTWAGFHPDTGVAAEDR